MGGEQISMLAGSPAPSQSRFKTMAARAAAILAQLTLVDAAVETFWSGSPIRWWIVLPTLAFVGLNAWLLLRPGGRHDSVRVAAWSCAGLFMLLVASAWLPGGNTDGVRVFLQSTSTLLTVVTAGAVVLAVVVLLRDLALVPPRGRLAARAALLAAALYALAAFAIALHDRAGYPTLFQGGAAWGRLPLWLQGTTIGGLFLLPLAIVMRFLVSVQQGGIRGIATWRSAPSLVLGLTFTIALSGYLGTGAVRTGSISSDVAREGASVVAAPEGLSLPDVDLPKALEGARRLMAKTHPETYDVSAAARTIGTDIERNFAFVRDQLAFDPYVGCLRGAPGALMARAGNAIDRSLLLAALLTANGHGARLVHGRIDTPDAARLLARAAQPLVAAPVTAASVEDAAAVSGLPAAELRRLVDAAKGAARQFHEGVDARVQHHVDFIQQKLRAAGIHLSPAPAVSPDTLRDHVWVQVQVDGGWKDLDSSFAEATVGQRFAEPEGNPIRTDSLPDAWFQTLGIRVLSFRQGVENADVVLNRRMKVADLVLQPLALAFAPQGDGDPLTASAFKPTLLVAKNVFKGSNIELSTSTAKAGGTGGPFGSFRGGGAGEQGKTLARVLLEVTLDGPGAAPERMTRTIVDTPETQDAARRVTEMREQLVSIYQFVVGTGPVSPEWVVGQQLAFLNQMVSQDEKNRTMIPVALLNLVSIFMKGDGHAGTVRRYYARPFLIGQRVRFRTEPGGTLAFVQTLDILHNRVEFVGGDALAAVRQGALETELERSALSGTEVSNTATVFDRSQAAVQVLGPGDRIQLDQLGLPAEAKTRIAEDLTSGYAVVVPSASVQIGGRPAVGWWRVRAAGGETLGRMQSGEGQSMTERVILQGPTTGYSFFGSLYCKHISGSTSGFCNPCALMAAGLAGFVVGLAFWLLASVSWLMTFVMLAASVIGAGYGAATKTGGCLDKASEWGKGK